MPLRKKWFQLNYDTILFYPLECFILTERTLLDLFRSEFTVCYSCAYVKKIDISKIHFIKVFPSFAFRGCSSQSHFDSASLALWLSHKIPWWYQGYHAHSLKKHSISVSRLFFHDTAPHTVDFHADSLDLKH